MSISPPPPVTPPNRSSISNMARISVPSPMLPLSLPTKRAGSLSPPSSAGYSSSTSPSPRRAVRRLSYNLKHRVSKYSFPLTLGLLFTTFIIYLTSPGLSTLALRRTVARPKAILHTRHAHGQIHLHDHGPKDQHDGVDSNGISFLTQDSSELIAEDDLYFEMYHEPEQQSEEELEAEKEAEEHRKDVVIQNKKDSLRALIWWLADGGVFPKNYRVPSKKELGRMGSRGVEKLLREITQDGKGESMKDQDLSTTVAPMGAEEDENDVEVDAVFPEGWQNTASSRYKVTVFSKSYCPYSKNAKTILSKYSLVPAPYIVELDLRDDMAIIQTFLKHLTARRTVPNVIFNFRSFGGSDELTLIHSEGGLQKKFLAMQAVAGYPGWSRPMRNPQPPKELPPPAPILPPPAPIPEIIRSDDEEFEKLLHVEIDSNSESDSEANEREMEDRRLVAGDVKHRMGERKMKAKIYPVGDEKETEQDQKILQAPSEEDGNSEEISEDDPEQIVKGIESIPRDEEESEVY